MTLIKAQDNHRGHSGYQIQQPTRNTNGIVQVLDCFENIVLEFSDYFSSCALWFLTEL